MNLIKPLIASSLVIQSATAALLVQYNFENTSLNPTTIADPTLLTAGPLTGDFPATIGATSNTTALRRLYYDNRSGFDNDPGLAVQTRWGNVTPTMRVQSGRTDLASAIANNSFFTITLNPQQAVSLASLAFDVSGSGNPDYPLGMTVRSSLTGTTNLFSTSFIAGLQGAPDFVNVDLSVYPEFQDFTQNVTFTFYLYAAANNSNLGISFTEGDSPYTLLGSISFELPSGFSGNVPNPEAWDGSGPRKVVAMTTASFQTLGNHCWLQTTPPSPGSVTIQEWRPNDGVVRATFNALALKSCTGAT
ncbi:MAG: hypothetical protein EOP85_08680, partial [Verrucomicrobiaceae bacterium]